MSWVTDRQITIYSRVASILDAKLGEKYTDLNVTMDNAPVQNAKFPTVYVTFRISERGQTLDGNTINAVNMTVEVHVKTSKAQGMIVNDEVTDAVVDALKTIRINMLSKGIPISNIDGVYESVSMFQRTLGQGDVI